MIDLTALTDGFSKGALFVTDVYWVTLPAGERYTNYRTPEAGFLFVIRGEGRFVFEGANYEAVPGSVLHGGSNMRLDYGSSDHAELEYCLVHYYSDSDSYRKYIDSHYKLQFRLHSALIELLRTIRASSEIPGALSSLRTQSLFYQLLYETIAGCQHRIHKPESTVIVQDAIEFIQVNYMYPITLTELAERYQISAGFFSSQFRKQTGMSPIDYLIRFRVRRAKELLAASRYSVREIAQSVGYAYVYYFSRLFKQHTGFSPSQLRPSPNGVD